MAQAETDALLQNVKAKLADRTFDPGDTQTLTQMVESFADSRGMVRLALAETLGQIGMATTPVLVRGLAHHENPVVRRACAKTLTLTADPSAIPTLLEALLNDRDTVVQGSAIGALARIGAPVVPDLLEILASPDRPESIKGHAAWALAFIGKPAKDQLYEAIASDSPEVRCAVIGAIGTLARDEEDSESLNLLIAALSDPAAMVRAEAATALSQLSDRSVVTSLIPCLKDADSEVRKTVALALMKFGDRTPLDPLKAALAEESEPGVQKAMQVAIARVEQS
jgi:bilin biosynthesis protein